MTMRLSRAASDDASAMLVVRSIVFNALFYLVMIILMIVGLPTMDRHVTDQFDYLVTLARLRFLDALAGPLPETSAERQRQRDREMIKRGFPEIEL